MSRTNPLDDLIALLLLEDPYAPFRHTFRMDCSGCDQVYSATYGEIAIRARHICQGCGLNLHDELNAQLTDGLQELWGRYLVEINNQRGTLN